MKAMKRVLGNGVFVTGMLLFLTMVGLALGADRIAPYGYDEIDVPNALQPPSAEHPFGTDHLGRDVFSRVVYGSRIALRVGLIVVAIQGGIGILLGLAAGYFGGWVDRLVVFATDVTWSLPPLVFAIAIVMALGPSLDNVVVAIALVSWGEMARVVRGKTQAVKSMPYVEAARAIGYGSAGVIGRHVFPNVLPPIIVLLALALPSAILSTTALSFLGLGAQPPSPDWGVMLSESVGYVEIAPWMSIFPGVALVWTVLGFNLMGVGLREILDPRLRG